MWNEHESSWLRHTMPWPFVCSWSALIGEWCQTFQPGQGPTHGHTSDSAWNWAFIFSCSNDHLGPTRSEEHVETACIPIWIHWIPIYFNIMLIIFFLWKSVKLQGQQLHRGGCFVNRKLGPPTFPTMCLARSPTEGPRICGESFTTVGFGSSCRKIGHIWQNYVVDNGI